MARVELFETEPNRVGLLRDHLRTLSIDLARRFDALTTADDKRRAAATVVQLAARSVESYERNLKPIGLTHKYALMWVPEQLAERFTTNKPVPDKLTLGACLGYATTLSAGHNSEWEDYLQLVRAGLPPPAAVPAGDSRSPSLVAMQRAVAFWHSKRPDGSARFPHLAPIAMRILAIPLGVAAVERSFNQTRTQQAVRRLNQSHENREYEAYLVHNRRFLRKTLKLVQ